MQGFELVKIEEIPSGAVVLEKSVYYELLKAAQHKYIKREVVSTNPKKYRYWYKTPQGAIVSQSSLHEGAKFRQGKEGEHGHYAITKVHKDNKGNVTHVTIAHDERTHEGEKTVSVAQLRDLIHSGEHYRGESVEDKTKRILRDYRQVLKTGTPKQIDRLRNRLMLHAEAYPEQMSHFGEEFAQNDPKVKKKLEDIATNGTSLFVTHKGAKTKGKGAEKKKYGGQKVHVELEHASYGDIMDRSWRKLKDMGSKDEVVQKLVEKTGVDKDVAATAYDEVFSSVSKEEPLMAKHKKPLVINGKVVPGATVYVGSDPEKQGTIYFSGLVKNVDELEEGHGAVPPAKSSPKVQAKEALMEMLPAGKHRQYTMTLEALDTLLVHSPKKKETPKPAPVAPPPPPPKVEEKPKAEAEKPPAPPPPKVEPETKAPAKPTKAKYIKFDRVNMQDAAGKDLGVGQIVKHKFDEKSGVRMYQVEKESGKKVWLPETQLTEWEKPVSTPETKKSLFAELSQLHDYLGQLFSSL